MSPRLSPNGKQLLFIAPDQGVMNVWVAPSDDPKSAKAITHERTRPIRFATWAKTNEQVLYTNDKGGDENFHIFAVDLKSGQEKDLTPFEGVRAEVSDTFIAHPTWVLATMNKRDKKFMDPVVIDVKTGKIDVLAENTEGYAGYVNDDDAKLRMAVKILPDGSQEYLVPGKAKGATWTSWGKVLHEDVQTTEPLFFERNKKTLYFKDSRGRDTSASSASRCPTGAPTLLFEDPKADAEALLVDPKTEPRCRPSPATASAASGTSSTRASRATWTRSPRSPPATSTSAAAPTTTSAGSPPSSATTGRSPYYLWDRDKKAATFLFVDRPALEKVKLTKMHPVVIKSRDGFDLVSYLSLPRAHDVQQTGKSDQPLPLVLFVHGGPWARDQWGLNGSHQWLADRGYAVLSVNYRASTGFGKKFLNAGDHEWAGKMHDDLLDAVKWAVDQKIADPQKVAIMGGSYGGYATLVGLTFTPDVFACGVDIVGPSNLLTLLNSIPPYWAPVLEDFAKRIGDHRTEDGKKLLAERSPLTRAEAIKRPLLIGQGANDPRVKQAESDQIVKAMHGKNLPVTYVLYPDEGHGFARPENRLSFNAVAEVFLAEHLGGSYQPAADDFKGSSITVPSGADQVFGVTEAIETRIGCRSLRRGATRRGFT